MSSQSGIPKGAAIAINDMLDHCARVQPGQEVLLLAHLDGLHGGDNLVDQEAISWIQTAIQLRGANASILWIDEIAQPHAWRFPPIVKGAISACDVLINHSFNIVVEEITEFREFLQGRQLVMVRNFATTAPLLCTAWAQTPYELVSEIRYRASLPIKEGMPWQLTDENGTHLAGKILPATASHLGYAAYSQRREETGAYRPWPEWVHPPINLAETSGIFIFDRMLSWWSRYIGIPSLFNKPIRLSIDNNRITKIDGEDEADSLNQFLSAMRERLGDGVYDFNCLHFGVHPQAAVAIHQCPNILHRRLVEHSNACNIHVHIGAPKPVPKYHYWMHITGDIRHATFKVGDTLIHERGHLMALDHPAVQAVAAKYPGRPGIEPVPRSD